MQYEINGQDVSSYGVTITNGFAEMFKMPERKDSLTNDWQDENGIEKDLTDPKFKSRQFRLNCVITGDDFNDLKTKYWAFFTLVSTADTIQIYNYEYDTLVGCFYVNQEQLTPLAKTGGSGKPAAQFTVVFAEVSPEQNISPVFLVNEEGEYLIA